MSLLRFALLFLLACNHRVDNVVEGSRLHVRSASLPSGEEVAVDLWDAKLHTPCTFVGETCVPIGALVVYRDDNCTQPLVIKTSNVRCNQALGAETFAVESVTQACEQKTRIFRLGAATSAPAVVYQKTAAGCASRGALSVGDNAHELGQALDSGELFSAKRSTLVPLGRIGFSEKLTGSDGSVVEGGNLHGALFDREQNVACEPRAAADGVTRCLPGDAPLPSIVTFSDAECTSAALSVPSTACGDAPRFAAAIASDSGCTARAEMFSVAATIEDTFADVLGVCTPLPRSSTSTAYSLAPVAASSFAELVATPALATARLTVRSWVGNDGKRIRFEGIFDNDLAIRCAPVALGPDDARCLPTESAELAYTDASCRQPVIVRDGCSSAPYALRADSSIADTCSVPSAYLAGEAVAEPAALFAAIGGTCAPKPLAPGAKYAKAEAIAIDTFAAITLRKMQ